MKKLGLRKKSRIFNGRTGKGLPLLGTLRTMSESKEALRERKSREKRIRGRKYKKLLVEHFGGKCVTCGYDRCPASFDFHHPIPEEKEFTIASELGSMTYQRLLKEAEKCMLLCSNCHRELHYYESEEFAEVNRDSETTLPDLLCEESEVSDVPLCLSVEEESSDFNWAEQS